MAAEAALCGDYEAKLRDLQKYVPFLENTIKRLKSEPEKPREAQISKLQSLLLILTDTKRKLKFDALRKCEDVILKLYDKVEKKTPIMSAHKYMCRNPPEEKSTQSDGGSPSSKAINELEFTVARHKLNKQLDLTTPASPSPPPVTNVIVPKPIVIPTEKVVTPKPNILNDLYVRRKDQSNLSSEFLYQRRGDIKDSKSPQGKNSVWQRLDYNHIKKTRKDDREIINYANVDNNNMSNLEDKLPNKSSGPIKPKRPLLRFPLTKPVPDKPPLSESDLQDLLSPSEQPSPPISEQAVNDDMDLDKLEQLREKINKELEKDKLSEKKSSKMHRVPAPIPTSKPKTTIQRVIKEPDNIFGNLLSSIDEQIIEKTKEQHVHKKTDKKDVRVVEILKDDLIRIKPANKDEVAKKSKDPKKVDCLNKLSNAKINDKVIESGSKVEDTKSSINSSKESKTKVESKDSKSKVETKDSKSKIESNDLKSKVETKDSKLKVESKVSKSKVESKDSKSKIESNDLKSKVESKDSKSKIESNDLKSKVESKDSKSKVESKDSKSKLESTESKSKVESKDSKPKVETKDLKCNDPKSKIESKDSNLNDNADAKQLSVIKESSLDIDMRCKDSRDLESKNKDLTSIPVDSKVDLILAPTDIDMRFTTDVDMRQKSEKDDSSGRISDKYPHKRRTSTTEASPEQPKPKAISPEVHQIKLVDPRLRKNSKPLFERRPLEMPRFAGTNYPPPSPYQSFYPDSVVSTPVDPYGGSSTPCSNWEAQGSPWTSPQPAQYNQFPSYSSFQGRMPAPQNFYPEVNKYDLSQMPPVDFYEPERSNIDNNNRGVGGAGVGGGNRAHSFRTYRYNESKKEQSRNIIVVEPRKFPAASATTTRYGKDETTLNRRQSISIIDETSSSRDPRRHKSDESVSDDNNKKVEQLAVKEDVASPLDSLYSCETKATGKGYGLQHFKIPKLKRGSIEESKEEVKKEVVVVEEKVEAQVVETEPEKPSTSKVEEVEKPKSEADEKLEMFNNFMKLMLDNSKTSAFIEFFNAFGAALPQAKTKRIRQIIESDSDESEDESKQTEKRRTDQPQEKVGSKKTEQEQAKPKEVEHVQVSEVGEPADVIESVGERIKNRRRGEKLESPEKGEQQEHVKTVKKRRNPLELLQDDIRNMFICDGVLTATGVRMCRMMKDHETQVLTTSETPTFHAENEEEKEEDEDDDETPLMKRKMKIPTKPKPQMKGTKRTRMASLRVLIEKTDISKYATPATEASDNEPPETQKWDTKSDIETQKWDHRLENNESDNDYVDIDEHEVVVKKPKLTKPKKGKKKMKRSNWALGVIKKKSLKMKQPLVEQPTSNEDSSFFRIDTRPDRDYYLKVRNSMYDCKLCEFKGKLIVPHYRTRHPNSEIMVSRLSPAEAEQAVSESLQQNYESIEPFTEVEHCRSETERLRKRRTTFVCRFCTAKLSNEVTAFFYDHISSHTGEYRYFCGECAFQTAYRKTLNTHYYTLHANAKRNTVSDPSFPSPANFRLLFGYLCGECNFTQLLRVNVEKHARMFHASKEVRIFKVSLSSCSESIEDLNEVGGGDGGLEVEMSDNEGEEASEVQAIVKEFQDKVIKIQAKARKEAPVVQAEVANVQNDTAKVQAEATKVQTEATKESEALNTQAEAITVETKATKTAEASKVQTEATKIPAEAPNIQTEASNIQTEPPAAPLLTEPPAPPPPTEPKPAEPVKEPDLTVFMVSDDVSQQEKRIEDERLKKMQEVNSNIAPRRSTFGFVDRLKIKLDAVLEKNVANNEDMAEEQPLEPMQEVNVVEEKWLDVKVTDVKTESVILDDEQVESEVESLGEPEVEESIDVSDVKLTLPNDSKQKGVIDTIQRLAAKLQNPKTTVPALSPNEKDTLTVFPIKIKSSKTGYLYSCLMPDCSFVTFYKIDFTWHCSQRHPKQAYPCNMCPEDKTARKQFSMFTLFVHVTDMHLSAIQSKETSAPSSGKGARLAVMENKETSAPSSGKGTLPPSSAKVGESVVKPKTKIRVRRISGDVLSTFTAITAPPQVMPVIQIKDVRSLTPSPPEQRITIAEIQIKDVRTLNEPEPDNFIQITNVRTLTSEEEISFDEAPTPTTTPTPPISTPTATPSKISDTSETGGQISKPEAVLKVLLDPMNIVNLYKCPIGPCSYSTNNRNDFKNHFATHENSEPIGRYCVYCTNPVRTVNLLYHIDKKHGHCLYQCAFCFYRAIVPSYVLIHLRKCHGVMDREKVIQLDVVPTAFSHLSLLDEPLPRKRTILPYICTQASCKLNFLTVSEFVTHLEAHHHKQYACCMCEVAIRYSTMEALICHYVIHRIGMYQCRFCLFGSHKSELLHEHYTDNHPAQRPIAYVRSYNKAKKITELNQSIRITDESRLLDIDEVNLDKLNTHRLNVGNIQIYKATAAPPPPPPPLKPIIDVIDLVDDLNEPMVLVKHRTAEVRDAIANAVDPLLVDETSEVGSATEKDPTSDASDNETVEIVDEVMKSDSIFTVPVAPPAAVLRLNVFGPEDLDQLPRMAVYAQQVKCKMCSYGTKVRTNMQRHLQQHIDEKTVPEIEPVNPVPCLEKNEKMFDKMTNLAASSHYSPAKTVDKTGDKDEDLTLPGFVPAAKRYVCGAENCNYLTHGDGMLRHHLSALHMDEVLYKCPHCKKQLCNTEDGFSIDDILFHMRMHDVHLYKCSHCNYYHYQKHKVERHLSDKHPDRIPYLHVIRELDGSANAMEIVRPGVDDNGDAPPPPPAPPVAVDSSAASAPADEAAKVWRCGFCQLRTASRIEVQNHAATVHKIKSQYKCGECDFRCSARNNYYAHFRNKHPEQPVKIISVYYKITDEELGKPMPVSETSISDLDSTFDTTPLWSRAKPRVRHIRGILLDDSNKSPKKLLSSSPTKIIIRAVGNEQKKIKKYSNKAQKQVFKPPATYGVIKDGESYACPVCEMFSCNGVDDFIAHLRNELNCYQFGCKFCSYQAIAKYQVKIHCTMKHGVEHEESEMKIVVANFTQVENWISKCVDFQQKEMLKSREQYEDEDLLNSSIETVLLEVEDVNEEEIKITDEVENKNTNTNTFQCLHCSFVGKTAQTLRRHTRRHFLHKPYRCKRCTFDTDLLSQMQQHFNVKHPSHVMDYTYISNWEQTIRPVKSTAKRPLLLSDPGLHPDETGRSVKKARVDSEETWDSSVKTGWISAEDPWDPSVKTARVDSSDETCDPSVKMVQISSDELWGSAVKKRVSSDGPSVKKARIDSSDGPSVKKTSIDSSDETCDPSVKTAWVSSDDHWGPSVKKRANSDGPSVKKPRTNSSDEPCDPSVKKPRTDSSEETCYVCYHCPRKSENLNLIRNHFRQIHANVHKDTFRYKKLIVDKTWKSKYACKYCTWTGHPDGLKQHHLSEHNDRECIFEKALKFKCNICRVTFLKAPTLRKHFQMNHPNESYSYQTIFEDESGEENPVESVTILAEQIKLNPETNFSCKYCPDTFDNLNQLTNHHNLLHSHLKFERETDLKQIKCPECSHTSNSYPAMRDHIRHHNKPYKCFYCPLVGSYPNVIKTHHVKEHRNLEFKCVYNEEAQRLNEELRERVLYLGADGVYQPRKRSKIGPKPEETSVSTPAPAVRKQNVAKKSTSVSPRAVARKSTTPRSSVQGFSYYGTQPPTASYYKSVFTEVPIMGRMRSVNVLAMSGIVDIFPTVNLVDLFATKKT